jgi:broad specificity phosphatase PhoE
MRTTVHLLRHGEVHNPTGVPLRPAARLPAVRRRGEDGARRRRGAEGRDVTRSSRRRCSARRRRPARPPELFGLPIHTDDRLIESGNYFEGKTVGVGDGAFSDPSTGRSCATPFTPSWGEPYVEIARRMLAAAEAARTWRSGHEAVCVSHQLPIWTVPALRRGAQALAPPGPPAVRPGVAHQHHLAGRPDRDGDLQRAGRRRGSPPRSGRVGDSPGAGA